MVVMSEPPTTLIGSLHGERSFRERPKLVSSFGPTRQRFAPVSGKTSKVTELGFGESKGVTVIGRKGLVCWGWEKAMHENWSARSGVFGPYMACAEFCSLFLV